jgi:hypothetical protein
LNGRADACKFMFIFFKSILDLAHSFNGFFEIVVPHDMNEHNFFSEVFILFLNHFYQLAFLLEQPPRYSYLDTFPAVLVPLVLGQAYPSDYLNTVLELIYFNKSFNYHVFCGFPLVLNIHYALHILCEVRMFFLEWLEVSLFKVIDYFINFVVQFHCDVPGEAFVHCHLVSGAPLHTLPALDKLI